MRCPRTWSAYATPLLLLATAATARSQGSSDTLGSLPGTGSGDAAGWAVCSLTDITDDGAPEPVVGEPGWSGNLGLVVTFDSATLHSIPAGVRGRVDIHSAADGS